MIHIHIYIHWFSFIELYCEWLILKNKWVFTYLYTTAKIIYVHVKYIWVSVVPIINYNWKSIDFEYFLRQSIIFFIIDNLKSGYQAQTNSLVNDHAVTELINGHIITQEIKNVHFINMQAIITVMKNKRICPDK